MIPNLKKHHYKNAMVFFKFQSTRIYWLTLWCNCIALGLVDRTAMGSSLGNYIFNSLQFILHFLMLYVMYSHNQCLDLCCVF